MPGKKRGLGRGLDALLPKDAAKPVETAASTPSTQGGQREVAIEQIQPGKYQPRSYFAEESLEELAASIQSQGVMQPIVLRALASDHYEIIAGERRWRAAQRAGLDKIPAVVRNVDDESALAMSLIENIQREDLNPLEEAGALQRLVDDFQLTHEELATAVGKSRSAVTNSLRLTHLEPAVADMLSRGDLDMGHARALLTLETEAQRSVASEIVSKGLSVRQTEELVRKLGQRQTPKTGQAKGVDADTRRLAETLGEQLGQPVDIRHTAKGKGKLVITYNSLDELDGILTRMGYKEL